MATIVYISKVIAAMGGLLALFEFLPPNKRREIDSKLSENLTWKLLFKVATLTIVFNLLLNFFPFIAPFFPLLMFLIFILMSKAASFKITEANPGLGCVYSLVSILIILLITKFVAPLQLQLFYGSIFLMLLTLLFSIWGGKDYSTDYFAILLLGFLLISLPSAVGYWWTGSSVRVLISPYNHFAQWFSDITKRNFFGYLIIPTFREKTFETSYLSVIDFLREAIPQKLAQWRLFIWYQNSSAGYLMFFAVFVQILFLYYLFQLLKFAFLSLSIPLIKFSSHIKVRFGIEQSRIPIVGAFLTLIGIILSLMFDTIEFMQAPR